MKNYMQNVGRHKDINRRSDEVSVGNKEYIIEQCKRYDPCYKVANKLFELCSCSSILWKVELVSDEMDVQL